MAFGVCDTGGWREEMRGQGVRNLVLSLCCSIRQPGDSKVTEGVFHLFTSATNLILATLPLSQNLIWNSFKIILFVSFSHEQPHNTDSWHEPLIISISSRPHSKGQCFWDMWGDNNVWSTQQQLSSSLLSTVSVTNLLSPLLSVFPLVQLSLSQPSCPLPSLAVPQR